MESEKILLCYRDDTIRKTVLLQGTDNMRIVAAIPCVRTIFGRNCPRGSGKLKKLIAELYENSGAQYLWLEDCLCEFLQMDKMDLPDFLVEKWLERIPYFHTIIFADDDKGRAIRFIEEKAEGLAAACVVCYEEFLAEYEELANRLFLKEGLVLQILTYHMLKQSPKNLEREMRCKGRTAVLDFGDGYFSWDKGLLKDMGYYSFWKEMRLFLDTFQKNRYNTLTK